MDGHVREFSCLHPDVVRARAALGRSPCAIPAVWSGAIVLTDGRLVVVDSVSRESRQRVGVVIGVVVGSVFTGDLSREDWAKKYTKTMVVRAFCDRCAASVDCAAS